MYITVENSLTSLEFKTKDKTIFKIMPTFCEDEYIIYVVNLTLKANKQCIKDIIVKLFGSETYVQILQEWFEEEKTEIDNKHMITSYKEFEKELDK